METVFAHLTPQQRIGQLFMLGLANDQLGVGENAAIRADHFGSVWFTETTSASTSRIRAITHAVQALTGRTGDVRFFIAANQEGGEIQALRGDGFSRIPAADELGTMDPSTLETDALRWGREMRTAGVNFDFAPVFDVVPAGTEEQNQPIGALHREFGDSAYTVAAHALAFARGMARAGIAASAKHFPGLGRVTGNTDAVRNVIDNVTTSSAVDLATFRQAAQGSVPFIMVALATYTKIDPTRIAAFSPIIVEQILRERLKFKGVIISDDLGATAAVRAIPPGRRAIEFLQAGGDMIISKTIASAKAMFDAILSRTKTDAGFSDRVADAVDRILESKRAAGLLPCR